MFAGTIFEKGHERGDVGLVRGEPERIDGFSVQRALELPGTIDRNF